MKADKAKLGVLMARREMSEKQLAREIDVCHHTVSRVCRGLSARPITLGLIARGLGVDVTEIIAEEDSHGQE